MGLGQYQLRLNKGIHPFQLPQVPLGEGIPRRIYQTYTSWDALKPEWKENIENIKAINPGWAYHFYDDHDVESFILQEYGADILALYQKINPRIGPARADLFRYLLLYKQGGVYLDLKSTITQPLDRVLAPQDQFILTNWSELPAREKELASFVLGEYIQWVILAVAGHPFLKAVIDNVLGNLLVYNPWLHGVGKRAALRITGPFAYTFAIASSLKGLQPPHSFRYVRQPEDMGIHYSVYTLNHQSTNIMAHEHFFPGHYSQNKELLMTTPSISHYLYELIRTKRKPI